MRTRAVVHLARIAVAIAVAFAMAVFPISGAGALGGGLGRHAHVPAVGVHQHDHGALSDHGLQALDEGDGVAAHQHAAASDGCGTQCCGMACHVFELGVGPDLFVALKLAGGLPRSADRGVPGPNPAGIDPPPRSI